MRSSLGCTEQVSNSRMRSKYLRYFDVGGKNRDGREAHLA